MAVCSLQPACLPRSDAVCYASVGSGLATINAYFYGIEWCEWCEVSEPEPGCFGMLVSYGPLAHMTKAHGDAPIAAGGLD